MQTASQDIIQKSYTNRIQTKTLCLVSKHLSGYHDTKRSYAL